MKKNSSYTVILIDTSKLQEVAVGLRINGEAYWDRQAATAQRAQRVLPLLLALMSKRGVAWDHITGIEVHPGPGSYTGLRVGFAVANALGFLLGVSVNGFAPGKQVSPRY